VLRNPVTVREIDLAARGVWTVRLRVNAVLSRGFAASKHGVVARSPWFCKRFINQPVL